jgi:antitoxin YefM
MNVTTISDFRKSAKKYLDQMVDDQDILVIARSNGQSIVAMPLDQYNSLSETDYLNSSQANRKHLEESIAQLRAGKLEEHDIQSPRD